MPQTGRPVSPAIELTIAWKYFALLLIRRTDPGSPVFVHDAGNGCFEHAFSLAAFD